jgi:hypothetical protein
MKFALLLSILSFARLRLLSAARQWNLWLDTPVPPKIILPKPHIRAVFRSFLGTLRPKR